MSRRPLESNLLEVYLKKYYDEGIFPFDPYTNWLLYKKAAKDYFCRREFAFIKESNGEEFHRRYQSFGSAAEFEIALKSERPHKLDLGAVYNHRPRERKAHGNDFKAMERELIFDIDMNDYDEVRTCCTGAVVCPKCWKFMVMAVHVMKRRIEEDFGFSALLWIFSGRRGIHCWVADEKARLMSNTARDAFVSYLTLFEGAKLELKRRKGKGGGKLHPMVEDSYEVLMEVDEGRLIEEMIEEQSWLENEEDVLKECHDDKLKGTISRIFTMKDTQRWKLIKMLCDEREWRKAKEAGLEVSDEPPTEAARLFIRHFVLYRLYPRLDKHVSTSVNHLLKSPFCIHPKTGNVAVPIEAEKIAEFNVEKCPRVDLLVEEVEAYKKMKREENEEGENGDKENRKIHGYKHSSLAPHLEIFERFVVAAHATNS